ncbi:putative 5'-nucleotidase [Leucoagaricus sp. SymC.cos]|nr:putative 5'-nucleotidase [Leucoagaricus sp. SymC.cos]
MTTLGIAHFNDVYQVSDQKKQVDGKEEVINVTKFAGSVSGVISKWGDRSDGKKDGLVVFSGDLFSPSIETSVTRGRHMPPIINALGVDVACIGNHEFDMGYPRLKELILDTSFPWLVSNIIDKNTGKVPEPMKDVHVLERKGVRIGFVGLVEKEWIATITGWPDNFEWQDYVEVGKRLSAKLRDPNGEYKADIVFAVTHCRYDIKLAQELGALSTSGQVVRDIKSEQGVDLILGGHDHIYWISKGVNGWENFDVNAQQHSAAEDLGDTLIVKSGTDYQDLSEISLVLEDTPTGSIRKKIIQEIKGKRIVTRGDTPVNPDMKVIFDREISTINAAMEEPICITEVPLDVGITIRLHETPIANWVTDCIRHSYDEALAKLGYPKVDAAILSVGNFRGGHTYQPGTPCFETNTTGHFTLGDLMTVLPYPDPAVVVEISATDFLAVVESALERWPIKDGRFPAMSGFRVSWDSRKPAGQRVLGIWLLDDSNKLGKDNKPVLVDKEEVLRTGTRKYLLMCGEHMARGGDGYDELIGKKLVITAENGQSCSALVRKYLLGVQFLNKQLRGNPEARKGLNPKALNAISQVENHLRHLPHLPDIKPPAATRSIPLFGAAIEAVHDVVHDTAQAVVDTLIPAVQWLVSTPLIVASHLVADHEDIGLLDCYERRRTRILADLQRQAASGASDAQDTLSRLFSGNRQQPEASAKEADQEEAKVDAADKDAKENIPVIHPVVDGRLKDVAGAAQ